MSKRKFNVIILCIITLSLISLSTAVAYGYFQKNSLNQEDEIYVQPWDFPPNAPLLAKNMNPVYWDGSHEIEKYLNFSPLELNPLWEEDQWYDYVDVSKDGMTDKSKWANAKTIDGSYWVWIPRFIYSVTSNWNGGATGTIEILFSHGTVDNPQNIVRVVDTGDSIDSRFQWSKHPAFTFGKEEITGFWVAKFAASQNGIYPQSIYGRNFWTNLTVNQIFTTIREMKYQEDRYGWQETEIDTHMMRKSEWGAMVYLTHSNYGVGSLGVILNNTTLIAGGSDSWNGIDARRSSTRNLYGVFDLTGGVHEHIAAYTDHPLARTHGNTCINVGPPYCEVLPTSFSSNPKGGAIYEVFFWNSNNGLYYGWRDSAFSYPISTNPWLLRGSRVDAYSYIFSLNRSTGAQLETNGFRPVFFVYQNSFLIDFIWVDDGL